MCMSVEERWPSAYTSVPLCINHLTQTYCWPWIYAGVRGSRWQCICLSHNGWYTKHAVIWQKCSPNGSRARQGLAKGAAGDRGTGVMDGGQPWVEPPAADSPPAAFFKTQNIAWMRAAISAAVGEADGRTGAYCALSSGAALWKYGGEIQCVVLLSRENDECGYIGRRQRHRRGTVHWASRWRCIIQPTTSHLVGSQALT